MGSIGRFWHAFLPLWLFVASVLGQAACTCSDPGQAPKRRPILACKSQHARIPSAPPSPPKTTVPGATTAVIAIGAGGDATLSMRLHGVPSHLESDLMLSYSSAAGEGVLGVGFSLSGPSAVTRCPKTMAIDGEVRAVQYDAADAFCMDGKRLVAISQNGDSTQFRTWPDSRVKVIGYFADASASYFEAFLPSGHVVDYGKTEGSRPMALGGVPRAWLATEERDARGNAIEFAYCFAEDPSGYVAEYALQELRHTAVDRTEPTSTVALVYSVKDDVRTVYSNGIALQQSLQLDEARMYGPANELARRYEFSYEQSEATGRTLVTASQQSRREHSLMTS